MPDRAAAHIGIVACSAEGAALCYRTICVEGPTVLGGHAHPEVSMHTPSLGEYVACLDRDDWRGVGALMLGSAHKLARILYVMITRREPYRPELHAATGELHQVSARVTQWHPRISLPATRRRNGHRAQICRRLCGCAHA